MEQQPEIIPGPTIYPVRVPRLNRHGGACPGGQQWTSKWQQIPP